ncbi:MAG: Tim44/TimA family putative adaptor protein [Bauldia sp.]
MNTVPFTLILGVIAVVIILRLVSVLGRRTGTEKPPFDPYSPRESERPSASEKVIALPRTKALPRPGAGDEVAAAIKSVAAEGTPLATQLRGIAEADKSFDPAQFLAGARKAYEIVVTAFAEGDRRALKPLLSREVNDGFSAAIADREAKEHKIEFKFVGVQKADITEAALRDQTAQVTVRFVSSLVSATRDKAGAVVDGDPTQVAEVTDIWTFARDVRANDPNWRLVATESVD